MVDIRRKREGLRRRRRKGRRMIEDGKIKTDKRIPKTQDGKWKTEIKFN